MSRDFRPRPGHRAVGTWPVDQHPPGGWNRDSPNSPTLVSRVLDGTPDDFAVEPIGYTETAECGVTSAVRDLKAALAAEPRVTRARLLAGGTA